MDRLFSSSAAALDASVASAAATTATATASRAAALNRRNTTSTMHVTDTMSRPDNNLIINEAAHKLWERIQDGERDRLASAGGGAAAAAVEAVDRLKKLRLNSASSSSSAADCENAPPQGLAAAPWAAPAAEEGPTPDDVAMYVHKIFTTAECSVDCTVVCVIYVERLLAHTGLHLTVRNWRSLIAIGMLLASKVWDDLSMVNADFAVFLPFTVEQINQWERHFLSGMKYDVRVPASVYARHYFDLRAAAAHRTGHMLEDGDAPLDVQRAQHLEALSSVTQKRVDEMRTRKGSGHRKAVSDQHLASDGTALPDAPKPHGGVSVMD